MQSPPHPESGIPPGSAPDPDSLVARAPSDWASVPVMAAATAAVGIVAVHNATSASIVSIWMRSETFAHGFLVVPIFLWLVWRQREDLAGIAASPWWPGLLAVLIAGAMWFVMSVAGVLGLTQIALAFMVQAAILTVVGLRVGRKLLFPLAFLLFAIPVGEIFVPTLIEWTADFTVAALRLSGIPVYREANHFVIPSGLWSVVEACSGIRYIIASVMVGTIYAAVAYRSASRRAWFIVAAILTPIVANWLRAYLIVMLGHLSDNRIAVGVDHLIYGWVFFGLVMFLLFWVGSFWQEAAAPARDENAGMRIAASGGRPAASTATLFAAALACIVASSLWLPLEARVARGQATKPPSVLELVAPAGWEIAAAGPMDWRPHYRGFAWDLQQAFLKDGREVGIYIAYYRNQSKGRELVTSGNQLVTMEDVRWKAVARAPDAVEWEGRMVPAERTTLAGPAVGLDAIRLYWVDGRVTSSEYTAKALTAWSKLRGRGDDSALIVIYAPRRAGAPGVSSTLREFAQSISTSLGRALDAVRASSG